MTEIGAKAVIETIHFALPSASQSLWRPKLCTQREGRELATKRVDSRTSPAPVGQDWSSKSRRTPPYLARSVAETAETILVGGATRNRTGKQGSIIPFSQVSRSF